MRWQETRRHIQCKYGRKYPWGPSWRCRRLHTGPKYSIISYFKCNRNIHKWLWAGSEPWVILELFLIFQDLSLMILIKIILIKKSVYPSISLCSPCKLPYSPLYSFIVLPKALCSCFERYYQHICNQDIFFSHVYLL